MPVACSWKVGQAFFVDADEGCMRSFHKYSGRRWIDEIGAMHPDEVERLTFLNMPLSSRQSQNRTTFFPNSPPLTLFVSMVILFQRMGNTMPSKSPYTSLVYHGQSLLISAGGAPSPSSVH